MRDTALACIRSETEARYCTEMYAPAPAWGSKWGSGSRVKRFDLYGLPIATAVFGVAGTVLGLMSLPVGATVAVSGAILVAALDISGRFRADSDARAAGRAALERLAEAALAFRHELENGMPLGGTNVPDGTVAERLDAMAAQLREHRFAFLKGRQWSDSSWLGAALTKGRQEILAAAGLTGGRLPRDEDARVRAFATLVKEAAKHAYEISSHFAGYDVTEEPRQPRYMPADQEVDVTVLPMYSSFAEEFAAVLADLDRMRRLV